jgi:AcrR family transcriptional regulator
MEGDPDAPPTTTPPRGRYDRRKAPAQRQAEHTARLVAAAVSAVSSRGRAQVTVSDLVHRARVGRNTFYAHFRDLDVALARAEDQALEVVWRRTSEALAVAYTPIEKLRAIARGWLDALSSEPELMRVLLQAPSRTEGWALTRAGEALRQLLRAALADARRSGVLSIRPDELRLLGAAATLEALARRYLDRGAERDELESTMVDLVLRAFR